MSKAKELLTKGNGVTRMSYLLSVAAERVSTLESDNYQSIDMLRGTELEPFALAAYTAETGNEALIVGYVEHDDARIGCSPDALTETGVIEIKCPLPKNHLRYLDRNQVAKDHGQQIQGNAWVCSRDWCDFVSFCPWVEGRPLIIHRFERDEKIISDLALSATSGADQVDEIVASIRSATRSEKVDTLARQAISTWEAIQAEYSGEVEID